MIVYKILTYHNHIVTGNVDTLTVVQKSVDIV